MRMARQGQMAHQVPMVRTVRPLRLRSPLRELSPGPMTRACLIRMRLISRAHKEQRGIKAILAHRGPRAKPVRKAHRDQRGRMALMDKPLLSR